MFQKLGEQEIWIQNVRVKHSMNFPAVCLNNFNAV